MTSTPAPIMPPSHTRPTCSVIICAYTDKRWDLLCKGYHASVAQLHPGDEVIVVIDHNPDLYACASAEFRSASRRPPAPALRAARERPRQEWSPWESVRP